MSPADNGYRVGYRRPPIETRWKKGQSGDPRGRKPRAAESAVQTIDKLLAQPISVTLKGEAKKIPALRAILLRLQQLAVSGSARACRVIHKYEAFASKNAVKKLELAFIDSDYTRAFSKFPTE
jgi:hypothetical protein